MTPHEPTKRADDSGVSKVVGGVLMIAIVLLLAAFSAVTFTGLVDDKTNTYSLAEVDWKETKTALVVESRASLDRGQNMVLKINGKKVRTWKDYSAGTTQRLFCLEPGDKVSLVSSGEQQQVIAEHEMGLKTDCKYRINVSGTTSLVSPVGWNRDDANGSSFYSYGLNDNSSGNHYHAHMDPSLQKDDTTYVFFYEYNNDLSLVIVHDKPTQHNGHCNVPSVSGCTFSSSASGGGKATMRFDNLPPNANWIVRDDNPGNDDYKCGSGVSQLNPPKKVCWRWHPPNGDGGVLTGGFSGKTSRVDFELNMTFKDGMDGWAWVSGSSSGGTSTTPIGKDQNLSVEGINASMVAGSMDSEPISTETDLAMVPSGEAPDGGCVAPAPDCGATRGVGAALAAALLVATNLAVARRWRALGTHPSDVPAE